MAYIPGYNYDIFISYAHLDNEKLPGQTDGWIELFYKSLQLKLAQRIGKMDSVKIWWDSKKLDGSTLFDDSIENGIKDSAIMISLLSPGYLNSDYCMKELQLFTAKAAKEKVGLKVGDSSRIIKVLLNNIPYSKWPAPLAGSTGFPFYFAKDKENLGDPLDATSGPFMEQLKELRDALVELLNEFPKDQTTVAEPVTADAASAETITSDQAFTIYFGEVADSMRTVRKRTIAELEKKGYKIVTGVPPPDEPAAHAEKALTCINEADLAVHLLDEFPGREIVGQTDNWYPKAQLELSLQHAKSKVVWMPAEFQETDIEEEAYKKFVQSVAVNVDTKNQFDLIRGNKSELARQINDLAVAIQQSKAATQADEKISVLLDTHFNDQQYAFTVGQALLQNNIQPYINPQEDNPHKNMQFLADRMSSVNKLVFFYGTVTKEWVLERMSAALQLIVTNNYPIDDFIIYLAPPNKTDDSIVLNQRFIKVNLFNNSAYATPPSDRLNSLVKSIKG